MALRKVDVDGASSYYKNPQLIENKTEKNTPYFDDKNSKTLRKGTFDITIKYGVDKSVSKTIKAVKLRSVGQEIDASGNPIFDVYEFVAQDIYESDNKIEDV